MSLVRNTATIGGFTLVSRVLGLVRDALMARFVGAGFASDAFLVAWRLPNLFRALFAEGAFASAFVPMFNRTVAEAEQAGADGHPAGRRFAEDVLSVLFPFLAVFTTVMVAFPDPFVWAITFGFNESGGAAKLALATELTRITFPYLMLISLVSLLGGILNSLGRFWVNAAAPVLLNLCMIAGLLWFRGTTGVDTARTQAIAVTMSGVAQLAWLIWSCHRAGFTLRLRRPRLTPQVRTLLAIAGPAALGAGAVQFNLMISTMLASGFLPEKSVSWLYYADRLNQLPLGLIGIGVGTAILPALSRQIGSGNAAGAVHTQNRAIELSLLLTLPATVALFVSAVPLVRGLFQGVRFTALDTQGCAAALAAFSLGLPAYILIKVLTPGFYARADTRTPVRVALVAMLANLLMNLGFVFLTALGVVGLALSTAASAWINVALLYAALRRRGQFAVDGQLGRRTVRLALASVAMGAVLLLLNPWIDAHTAGGLVERTAALSLLIGIGGIVYFGAALLCRAFALSDLKAQLSRRRA